METINIYYVDVLGTCYIKKFGKAINYLSDLVINGTSVTESSDYTGYHRDKKYRFIKRDENKIELNADKSDMSPAGDLDLDNTEFQLVELGKIQSDGRFIKNAAISEKVWKSIEYQKRYKKIPVSNILELDTEYIDNDNLKLSHVSINKLSELHKRAAKDAADSIDGVDFQLTKYMGSEQVTIVEQNVAEKDDILDSILDNSFGKHQKGLQIFLEFRTKDDTAPLIAYSVDVLREQLENYYTKEFESCVETVNRNRTRGNQ